MTAEPTGKPGAAWWCSTLARLGPGTVAIPLVIVPTVPAETVIHGRYRRLKLRPKPATV